MNLPARPSHHAHPAGFTLVEVMITMVTTVIILGGVLAVYLYGLRMVQFVQPKISASADARKAVSLLTEEIRTAYDLRVGQRVGTAFQVAAPYSPQVGNAIQIFPGTNTNTFVFYFWDVNDKTLKRTTNGSTRTEVVATSVNSSNVFSAEDFQGRVLSNRVANFVLGVSLDFYQIQYPTAAVGPGNYYDWYQLRSKVTKRTFL